MSTFTSIPAEKLMVRGPARRLRYPQIIQWIETMERRYPKFASAKFYKSGEIEFLVSDPTTTQPLISALWNLDPHGRDEQISTAAGLYYASALLGAPHNRHRDDTSVPPYLKGRSLRLLLTAPDDHKFMDRYRGNQKSAPHPLEAVRNSNIDKQSGWSRGVPGRDHNLESQSSMGFRFVDRAMREEVIVSRNRLRHWVLYVSGHNSLMAPGAWFHVGGRSRQSVARSVEQALTNLRYPVCDLRTDGFHLPKLPGTMASFDADTAAARHAQWAGSTIGCSDTELAHYYDDKYLSGKLSTLLPEIPENQIDFRDLDLFVTPNMMRDLEKLVLEGTEIYERSRSFARNYGQKSGFEAADVFGTFDGRPVDFSRTERCSLMMSQLMHLNRAIRSHFLIPVPLASNTGFDIGTELWYAERDRYRNFSEKLHELAIFRVCAKIIPVDDLVTQYMQVVNAAFDSAALEAGHEMETTHSVSQETSAPGDQFALF